MIRTGQLWLAVVSVLLAGFLADEQLEPKSQSSDGVMTMAKMMWRWFAHSDAVTAGGANAPQARAAPKVAAPAVSPSTTGPVSSGRTATLDPASARERLEVFLLRNCAACHGPDSVVPQFNAKDFDALIRDNYLVAGQPDRSRIFMQVRERRMPPPQLRPLGVQDRSNLGYWIEDLQPPTMSIVDTLERLGCTEFVAAAKKAGLDRVVVAGGPYTIFAPTNTAMEGLNVPDNNRLWSLLLNYAVLERCSSEQLEAVGAKTTVGGLELKVERRGEQLFIGGAGVLQPNVTCDNAVIHVIDQMFEPLPGPSTQPTMVRIEGGAFLMGAPANDKFAEADERPQVPVRLSPFLLGATEVTRAQYMFVMHDDPSFDRQKPTFFPANQPVRNVSWALAAEFCNELSITEGFQPYYDIRDVHVVPDPAGNGYRLPTEAEWEWAARAGSTDTYCFGDNPLQLGNYAVFSLVPGSIAEPQPVGGKLPNDWGLYDMHGNVQEWCQDWYGPYDLMMPGAGSLVDSRGPQTGEKKVYRGGAYWRLASYCRSAARGSATKKFAHAGIGFRVARTPKGARVDSSRTLQRDERSKQ